MHLISDENQLTGAVEDILEAKDGDFDAEKLLFHEPDTDGPRVRYGYQTSGMNILVPEGSVSELQHGLNIYHLPNAPKWICGLINMHGNVIPVVDVASISGNEISHISKSNILVIKKHDAAVGVLIDGFPEAITENEHVINTSGIPAELRNYIKEGLSSNGDVWHELDIYSLLKELAILPAGNNND